MTREFSTPIGHAFTDKNGKILYATTPELSLKVGVTIQNVICGGLKVSEIPGKSHNSHPLEMQ